MTDHEWERPRVPRTSTASYFGATGLRVGTPIAEYARLEFPYETVASVVHGIRRGVSEASPLEPRPPLRRPPGAAESR